MVLNNIQNGTLAHKTLQSVNTLRLTNLVNC